MPLGSDFQGGSRRSVRSLARSFSRKDGSGWASGLERLSLRTEKGTNERGRRSTLRRKDPERGVGGVSSLRLSYVVKYSTRSPEKAKPLQSDGAARRGKFPSKNSWVQNTQLCWPAGQQASNSSSPSSPSLSPSPTPGSRTRRLPPGLGYYRP